MLDVHNAEHFTGGLTQLPTFWVEGVFVEPPTTTRSSQVTGAGATALRGGRTGGFVKIGERVRFFAGAEDAILSRAAAFLTSGQAVWHTLVGFPHRVSGNIDLRWVPGDVAAVASAVEPTKAEIAEYLELDERQAFVVCGSIRHHRSADTVIVHQVKDGGRPCYVEETAKSTLTWDETDQSNMGEVEGGHIDFAVNLVQLSGVAAGSFYIDGAQLPRWAFGGRIYRLEYIPGLNGTGAGATQDVIANIDGTPTTGGTLTLTLANAVVPTPVVSNITGANKFKAGDTLDIEVDNVGTDFTAGTGTLRVHLKRYARRG